MNWTRRNLLKLGTLAGLGLATGQTRASTAREGDVQPAGEKPLDLRVSGYDYDHVRALIDGDVQIAGCNTIFQPGKIGDLNTHESPPKTHFCITEANSMRPRCGTSDSPRGIMHFHNLGVGYVGLRAGSKGKCKEQRGWPVVFGAKPA
jgi:hypothetical protein